MFDGWHESPDGGGGGGGFCTTQVSETADPDKIPFVHERISV